MPLSSSFVVQLNTSLTKAFDLGSASAIANIAKSLTWATGTGANQADKVFHDQRTLAASASESLDVASGGGLLDAYGDAFALARIKLVWVFALAANTNDVNFARPANGVPIFLASSDGVPVRPGGFHLWCSPDATGVVVTAGTGDLLSFTNSAGGTSVTYDVLIIGASA